MSLLSVPMYLYTMIASIKDSNENMLMYRLLYFNPLRPLLHKVSQDGPLNICILNYIRNPSVTSRGIYGNQNKKMKIYLYYIP